MRGILFLIVGASGVGKDTLIDLLKCRLPDFYFPRRYITRDADKGGEDYIAVSTETFDEMVNKGEFCVHWQAHGLQYGAHSNIKNILEDGRNVVLNTSRSVIEKFEQQFANTVIVEVTANREALRERLTERGRENAEDIDARLLRKVKPICCEILEKVDNSADINCAFAALVDIINRRTS